MKKKIFYFVLMVAALTCIFALAVSASPQNYQSYEAELLDGEKITVYQVGAWDQWQGRIWVSDVMYTEPPVDSEGTYQTIDISQIEVLDFTNAWGHIYNSTTEEHELKRGTNGSMHVYKTGFTPEKATGLKKIITGAATLIGGATFGKLPAFEEVVVDNALVEFGWNSFEQCKTLKTITIKDGTKLSRISQQAFIGCTALESFTMPNTVTSMGDNVFDGCTSLKNVVWSTGMTTIPNSTFNGCTSLVFDIPNYITKIGGNSFKNCDALVRVVIPDGVKEIGGYAFSSCDNLEELVISDNCLVSNKLVGLAEYSPKLTSIRIPPLVTEIGYDNFRGCTSLAEIIWPNNLLKISGGQNFANTAITKVSFPNSLVYCNGGNFTNLEEIRFGASMTNLGDGILNYQTLKRVYMPATITTVGKNILGWSNPADSSSNITFIFTGTLEQAEELRALVLAVTEGTNHQPNSSKFYDAILVPASEFDVSQEPNGFHFVFGYNLCDAFYNGVHSEGVQINDCLFGCGRNCGKSELLENPKHSLNKTFTFGENGYFSAVSIKETCANCNTVTIDETVNAIFEWKGYSKSTFGDTYAVVQGFYIDRDALAQYKVYAPDFDFGIMATGNAKGEAIKPQIGDEKVFTAIFDNTVNDYYDIKVTGITEELKDKNIVFCIYVLDSGKMYYLDGEKTNESVVGISYSSIIG